MNLLSLSLTRKDYAIVPCLAVPGRKMKLSRRAICLIATIHVINRMQAERPE